LYRCCIDRLKSQPIAAIGLGANDYVTKPFTRTVDMHIAKLRKKIEDKPTDPKYIVTIHRLGYKFTG